MPKLPKIAGTRSVNKLQFVITLLNFEAGDQWNVYQAERFGDLSKVVNGHTTAEVTIPDLLETGNYTFFVTLNNAPLSVAIISEHLDEIPPHYTVEATDEASLLQINETVTLPWLAEPILTTMTEVEGAIVEWLFSQPLMTFGKNQTL